MLVEEQARSLHHDHGQDLSTALEGIQPCVDEIEGECAAKAGQLTQLVMGISNALTNLGMLPVQDIPHLPKLAQEVLAATGLLLECLREAQTSDAGPWD
jgi:hypothetical protein